MVCFFLDVREGFYWTNILFRLIVKLIKIISCLIKLLRLTSKSKLRILIKIKLKKIPLKHYGSRLDFLQVRSPAIENHCSIVSIICGVKQLQVDLICLDWINPTKNFSVHIFNEGCHLVIWWLLRASNWAAILGSNDLTQFRCWIFS